MENVELIENFGFKKNELKMIESILEENKDIIIARWNEYFKKIIQMINKNDIIRIWMTDTAIWLQLKDKRQSRELFADYPRLANATPHQRENYTVSHFGIHWPELDEDLSFGGFFNKPPQNIVKPQ